MRIKIIGIVTVAVTLAGCAAAPADPIEVATACEAWVVTAATVPDGVPEATSAYLRSMADYLGNVVDMAEENAPGLKKTDPVAGGTFERLGEAALDAQRVTEAVASGARDARPEDAEVLKTAQSLSESTNELCF